MLPVSHQTIRLGKGKHCCPKDGACVMELASMLAGEEFSDHPQSVCPVIGSFLRAYNDAVDDRRRQDLYVYAAKVVGSRASGQVQKRREVRLIKWSRSGRRPMRWLSGAKQALLLHRESPIDAGPRAVRAIRTVDDTTHAAALALIEELLGIGQNSDGALVLGLDGDRGCPVGSMQVGEHVLAHQPNLFHQAR
jgi:hypothetical protein